MLITLITESCEVKYAEGTQTPKSFTVDTVKPFGAVTAKSKEGRETEWNKLITDLTFGFWSREEISITSTSDDETSPIASVEYYISEAKEEKDASAAITGAELDAVKEWKTLEKLSIEAPFCKYPTGGCITYVELDSTFMNNTKAIEQIIDYAFKALDIPYLAFNFPIDSCLDCGYQGEFNAECPECGGTNIEQLRRVTGYLTTDYRNFNLGKQSEVEHRVKHSKFS